MALGAGNSTGHRVDRMTGFSTKVGTSVVEVLEVDVDRNVLFARGATVPADADAGFAKGCLFIDTDASAGAILYMNEGTASSADFNIIESGSTLITAVVAGAGLTGGGTSGSVTLDVANTDGNITVSADSIDLAASLTLTKEGARSVVVGASTTADTAGGALNVAGGAGLGTGAGGASSLTGGLGGATGLGGNSSVVGGAGGATSGDGGDAKVTGGADTANNDDGGDVVLTGGAAHGTGMAGVTIIRSLHVIPQGAPAAKTTSTTLTAAELKTALITVNQAAGGASALQLPLATDLDTSLPSLAAGDAFDFSLINTSTVDAEDASVTTNTGWTLVGSMEVHARSAEGSLNSSGVFRARKTGAGAWTLYRIS